MKARRNIGAVFGIAVLFCPLFSPEWVTAKLVDWFEIRPPEPAPEIVPMASPLAETIRSSIDETRVRERMVRLSSGFSRVVGYPGHESAYRYIRDEFERIGLEDITTESFDVTSPIDRGGHLKVIGEAGIIPILGIWPNLVRTSSLPRDGLRAMLVEGGDGEFSDFNGKDLAGNIVLMGFNSWNRWMNASMLGAEAVIFIAPDSTTTAQAEQKFFQVPLNVPRFWIGREEGEMLRRRLGSGESIEVELKSRMVWEKHGALNVLGWIPGGDPTLKDQIILIDAYYDAMSAVPALAPGADQASGIVCLLELAEFLRAHPPSRTVLFLASSGHHLGFRGVCDFLNRHARKEEHFAKNLEDPIDVRLWISLDLSSGTDEIGIWNGGNPGYFQRFFARFGKKFSQLGREFAPSFGMDGSLGIVDGITPPPGLSWDMLNPGGIVKTDSEVVLTAGLPTVALVTLNDVRFRVDTPFDTVERLNLQNLTNQIRLITAVLGRALDDPELLPDYRVELRDRMRALKGRVLTFPRRSVVPDRPRPGAVVALRMSPEKSVKGVRTIFYDLADENGSFYVPGLTARRVNVDAYYLDPDSGEITYAPDMGPSGKSYRAEFGMDFWITRSTRILFPCVATDFYETVDPRHLSKLTQLKVYGEGNSAPQEYGYSLGHSPDEPVGVVFTRPGERVKLTMSGASTGIRLLLLNTTGEGEEGMKGRGFLTRSPGSFARTSFQAAKDMWALDEGRMRELRAYGIENQRLNTLHVRARDRIARAEEALSERKWDAFIKHTRAALGLESRAYPDVKGTQNDIVRGAIFFMALMIPFAFFAERLLVTAGDIRWQVVWTFAIFLAIWGALSLVHPAFSLSSPFVILLAFIILVLAMSVITLIFIRFNTHVRRIRPEGMAHDVDIGRISASLAAFQLGIANMKRRRFRTALTFSTLVLLTFTVLSFTSITSSLRFHRISRDNPGLYPGFLLRSKFWGTLEESSLDYTRASFGGEAIVAPRSWYASDDRKAIRVKFGDGSANAQGVLGLSPSEADVTGIESCLSKGRWFRDGERKVCVISKEMAGQLGLSEGDVGQAQLHLFGDAFGLVGLIDSARMKELKDLDGESMTPADFRATGRNVFLRMSQEEKREKAGLEAPNVEIASFDHLDPANVLIVPYQLLREVEGSLKSVAVRFEDPYAVKDRVEDFISRLAVVLFAGIPRGSPENAVALREGDSRASMPIQVSVYSSLGSTSLRGLSNLLIPIAIAGLIVLNTMLGSVYERFREIGIYSSVGLAPVHIGFLFLAEACVYAVLGTVSGYLLGQAVSKFLVWEGLLTGLTINYSALSTVASAGLVMAVTLLSTVFPARKASQMAVPDVTRRWSPPDPEGDRWGFRFPFTVGGVDALGLCAFLARYFNFHTEESMGDFYVEGVGCSAFQTESGEAYQIRATAWLAPYDLGVRQGVELKTLPTGERGIFSMELMIQRISGDRASWKRCNERFVNAIRKQFLIWRTLDQGAKEQVQAEGVGRFERIRDDG